MGLHLGTADHNLSSGAGSPQHSSYQLKRRAAYTSYLYQTNSSSQKAGNMGRETGCLMDKHFLGGTGGHLLPVSKDAGCCSVSLNSYSCLLLSGSDKRTSGI